ncbi:MAG TPA: hypothetical protein VHS96_13075 [Bacteroidia bacterium]|nr:hypothetical protein [Bacteroidia bacterium]
MSTEKKKRPFHHRIAFNYFLKLQADKPFPEDAHHILNEKELAWINRVKRTALLKAGTYGAVAVLTYYLPIYAWPEFWEGLIVAIKLPFLEFDFNWGKQIWSLLLVLIELFLLTRLNIWAVADTANACGFPDRRESNYDLHVEQLFTVGLESKNKETLRFGIDPYEDTPKFYLFLFTLWNLFRATLASFFLKFVVIKTILRNEMRKYADLVGVPLFFVWNAWATWKVIRAAEVYIMAPGLIQDLCKKVDPLHEDENFRQNIFDAMQYVVTVKRSFHHNHFLLVKRLVEVFDLKHFKDQETDRLAFLGKIKASEPAIKSAYSKLIVMGMIIDGGVSRREAKALNYLWTEGIISINPEQAHQWCRDFRKGRGLDALING